MSADLKTRVLQANLALVKSGLVFQTWGNASAIDRDRGIIVIKPSGVAYEHMQTSDMVEVDFQGHAVSKGMKPSVDTAIHVCLYTAFPEIGGIVHTHSHYATCFAQACFPIPCLGTTHADYYYGDIPVTAPLTQLEVEEEYEKRLGESLVFALKGRNPLECPAVLAAYHGPFVWGRTVEEAVENAIVLEEIARMAFHTLLLEPTKTPAPNYLIKKHFLRKHGKEKYYGQ